MKPWIHVYRGRCLEVRFGWWRWQAGVTLPYLSFVLWRNSDYERVFAFRWGRWLA
jgi:hypothetical protein